MNNFRQNNLDHCREYDRRYIEINRENEEYKKRRATINKQYQTNIAAYNKKLKPKFKINLLSVIRDRLRNLKIKKCVICSKEITTLQVNSAKICSDYCKNILYKQTRKRCGINYRKKFGKLMKHKRKAKTRSLDRTLTLKQWNDTVKYFDNKCCYCGNETNNLQQDHFIPLSKNGPYTKENIVPSCFSCNVLKSNKDYNKWYHNQIFYNKSRDILIRNYVEG